MKLFDILESATVTDINLARARRKVLQISKDAETYETIEQAANRAYADLYNWLDQESNSSVKLPGFTGYDDLAAYLLGDVGVPHTYPMGWSEWWDKLPEADKSKLKMIIHHGPRLLKIVNKLVNEMTKFEQIWTKEFNKVPTQSARPEVFMAMHETKEPYLEVQDALKRLIALDSVLIP